MLHFLLKHSNAISHSNSYFTILIPLHNFLSLLVSFQHLNQHVPPYVRMEEVPISAIFIRMTFISYIINSHSSEQRWLKFTETEIHTY